jgi:hypothetical protein
MGAEDGADDGVAVIFEVRMVEFEGDVEGGMDGDPDGEGGSAVRVSCTTDIPIDHAVGLVLISFSNVLCSGSRSCKDAYSRKT